MISKNKKNIYLIIITLSFIFSFSVLALEKNIISFVTVINNKNLTEPLTTKTTDISNGIASGFTKIEKQLTRTKRIESLLKELVRMKSPIANEHYATLIVDLAEESNADYRVLAAIMGTESGYCKKPIYYNCFGYLNKVKYESFDAAFEHLIPKISKQYVNKYGWNFEAFVKAYGQHGENAADNMRFFANRLFY